MVVLSAFLPQAPLAEYTEATREALAILRDASMFEWTTVTLLVLVIYVYAVEVGRQRWDVVLAGVAFWLMDWINELLNSAILHATGRAALWTTTGDTSYLILVGLTIEITLMFAISGIAYVHLLPADRGKRILGLPNRLAIGLGMSVFAVIVEVLLVRTGYFHWEYVFWNEPWGLPTIVVFGYLTFFIVAAWVYDMRDVRRQVRAVSGLGGIVAILAVVLGLVGWL